MPKNLQIILVAVALLACGVIAEAQQAKKMWRIGYLSSVDATTESSRSEGIRQHLRELGYTEGQNIAFEYRYMEGKRDRFPELAAEIVRLKVDVIVVAGGDTQIRDTKKATNTIPIVMMGQGLDPVASRLVESLARPGGNVTGITNLNHELGGKRLELLKDAIPNLSRVAVLYEPAPTTIVQVKDYLPPAARALKLTLRSWEIRGADDSERVFIALNKEHPDGLYVLGGPLTRANQKQTVGFALKSRLPSMYSNRESVEAGGFLFYGAEVADSYRQVAWYVDRILKGAKPSELPVQQPMKFEFVVNLQTAKKIGVAINSDLLARATKIIR